MPVITTAQHAHYINNEWVSSTELPTCDECGDRGKVYRFTGIGPGGSDSWDVCIGCLSEAASAVANHTEAPATSAAVTS